MEVVWIDAEINADHYGTLKDPSTAAKFGGRAECRDIGYLIRKNRQEVVLAVGLLTEDDGYRHSNTIPRGWIKTIIPLTRQEEKSNE